MDDKRDATHGIDPEYAAKHLGAPKPIDPATGQHESYWILSDAERAKGFVRPVRRSYLHVGPSGPTHPRRDLTDDEKARFGGNGYIGFEVYPETESPLTGRFWTQAELDAVGRGCRGTTTMGTALAETWARDVRFYGRTFCATCKQHLLVAEFVWSGTNERLGS